MGMYGLVVPVSEATIGRLHADPPLVMQILDGSAEAVEAARPKPKAPGLVARLFGAKAPPPPAPLTPLELAPGEGEGADVDKAWHGVHYLLTGSVWEGEPPLDFMLNGGTELDFDGTWDSPPRTFTPAETRTIAEALARLGDDELGRRYDPAEMDRLEIYPEIWSRDPQPGEDQRLWVLSAIADVRKTVGDAVARGWGLLVKVD
jgi:hypothetical protein